MASMARAICGAAASTAGGMLRFSASSTRTRSSVESASSSRVRGFSPSVSGTWSASCKSEGTFHGLTIESSHHRPEEIVLDARLQQVGEQRSLTQQSACEHHARIAVRDAGRAGGGDGEAGEIDGRLLHDLGRRAIAVSGESQHAARKRGDARDLEMRARARVDASKQLVAVGGGKMLADQREQRMGMSASVE